MHRFVLGLAFGLAGAPALADPMTDALDAGGGIACFTRSYDVAWLKTHSGQTVRQVTLALSDEVGPDEPALRLRFADARRTLYGSGVCFWKDDDINRGVQNNILDARFKPTSGAWCHMYTDITGGSAEEGAEFPIDWRNAQTIDIYLPEGLAMWTSYDIRRPASWHDIKPADQIIRLNRAPAEACQTLVTKFAPAEEPAKSSAPKVDAEITRLREEDAAAYEAGEYARAANASAQVLKLTAKRSGEISADYAQALEDHAINLSSLGRSAEAEPLHRRALALRNEVLGEKHPDTLTSLHNLASILIDLGRFGEAEPLIRRALALRTEVLGEKYPDTLASLHGLAFALGRLGRSAEAEPLNRRAFELRTEVLGEKHPDTLMSLHQVAFSLNEIGRSAEAEPLNRRALALQTEVLGEKHPDTISTLSNLAAALNALGRSAEAEPLIRRVLALDTEVLGEKHPDTLTSLHNAASILNALGRSAEAEPLHRRALVLRNEILGEKHPDTLASLHQLADTLHALGRAAEAEPLHRRALALRTEVLGINHPDTLASLHELPLTLLQLGRAAEAVAAGQPTNSDAAQTIRVPSADAEMALFVSGAGSQVIVLVAGYGGDHRTWTDVQPKLTKFGRVVSYDRLGSGASTRSKRPRVATNFVEDLRQGLKNAGLQPPYLLVGHSYGGIMVRLFASRYPTEVSGLVLVDPAIENFYRRAQVEAPQEYLKEYEKLQAEADASESETLRRDWLGFETSLQQLRTAPAVRGENIVILSAAGIELPDRLRRIWLEEHARWATGARSTHIYVKSGHRIPREQPVAVVKAIELLMEKVSNRARR